ncbi:ATP-binding protein [Corynebacterium sp.]|uniref:ATP-binding protein n=1 Tax=Corynebacterium sp. TaxID=1720 RepID=UPI0026E09171|nr:ATP-binding protein [Corynebacterium sp.]MDO5512208.1 ATP-binding protein [Corynebacterium sp.]
MNSSTGDAPCDEWLSRPENQYFDRKSFQIQPKDLAKSIVALANSDGGTLALGIRDRTLEGRPTPTQLNAFSQVSQELTQPTVPLKMEIIDCGPSPDSPQVVLLQIPPSDRVHERSDGQCFLRRGDQTMSLGFEDRLELSYSKGERQFDSTPLPQLSVDDLDADSLADYAATIGASDRLSALRGRHLLTRNGQVTVAAELLFGKDPQGSFPNALVRVIKFDSTDRTTGSRQTISHDRRFEGRITDILTAAAQDIRELVPTHKKLSSGGLFEWIPILPEAAWLEGLVNAVLHRSYSLIGDHIRIEIYPDRIEITNPGRFPGLADPRDPLSIARFARNPLIARTAIDLGIGQELGEGIRRIYEEMRLSGYQDPEYRQTSGSVTLILRAAARIDDLTMATLPVHSETILQTMQQHHRPLGTGDVAELSNVNRPAALRALKALRDAGLVIWHGRGPKDPRATWSLANLL